MMQLPLIELGTLTGGVLQHLQLDDVGVGTGRGKIVLLSARGSSGNNLGFRGRNRDRVSGSMLAMLLLEQYHFPGFELVVPLILYSIFGLALLSVLSHP